MFQFSTVASWYPSSVLLTKGLLNYCAFLSLRLAPHAPSVWRARRRSERQVAEFYAIISRTGEVEYAEGPVATWGALPGVYVVTMKRSCRIRSRFGLGANRSRSRRKQCNPTTTTPQQLKIFPASRWDTSLC